MGPEFGALILHKHLIVKIEVALFLKKCFESTSKHLPRNVLDFYLPYLVQNKYNTDEEVKKSTKEAINALKLKIHPNMLQTLREEGQI